MADFWMNINLSTSRMEIFRKITPAGKPEEQTLNLDDFNALKTLHY
jgi:hypothetical protein